MLLPFKHKIKIRADGDLIQTRVLNKYDTSALEDHDQYWSMEEKCI